MPIMPSKFPSFCYTKSYFKTGNSDSVQNRLLKRSSPGDHRLYPTTTQSLALLAADKNVPYSGIENGILWAETGPFCYTELVVNQDLEGARRNPMDR